MGVSSGDPLSIRASDWNRVLQDLRDWRAPSGAEPSSTSLPCQATILSAVPGTRRPCFGEVVSLNLTGFAFSEIIEATLPLGDDWEFGVDEAPIAKMRRMTYRPMRPVSFGAEVTGDLHQPFAVCINPRSMRFAVSGFALARVRYHSQWHRYVRRPVLLPTDSQEDPGSNPDVAKYTGCLDSSGSGRGTIVGIMDSSGIALYGGPPAELIGKALWSLIQW